MSVSTAEIEALIERIVNAVRPLRIILFGSRARGQGGPESDVDLLVVVPDGTHRRRTAQKLYGELQDMGVPCDLVIATASDIVKHRDTPGYIYRTALREGIDVYSG